MQIKTYTSTPPAPIPSTPSPYDDVLGATKLSAMQPEYLVDLNLATRSVLQCCVKSPDTGEFYASQTGAGTNGAETPFQTITISRCDANGNLQDSMTLENGGHGTSFGIEYSSGKTYLWVSYAQPASMALSPTYDLVRVPYAAGSFGRNELIGDTIMSKFDPGYSLVSFDYAADWAVVRTSNGRNETYVRRKISDIRNGVNKKYGVPIYTQQGPPSLQGFTTINNAFFRYTGTANGNTISPADPLTIEEYSWVTGKRVDKVTYPLLGADAFGQYPDGFYEPESCTSYRDPVTGTASLIFGITVGAFPSHTWPLYIINDIGAPV